MGTINLGELPAPDGGYPEASVEVRSPTRVVLRYSTCWLFVMLVAFETEGAVMRSFLRAFQYQECLQPPAALASATKRSTLRGRLQQCYSASTSEKCRQFAVYHAKRLQRKHCPTRGGLLPRCPCPSRGPSILRKGGVRQGTMQSGP